VSIFSGIPALGHNCFSLSRLNGASKVLRFACRSSEEDKMAQVDDLSLPRLRKINPQ
jgi:hypothetical protein